MYLNSLINYLKDNVTEYWLCDFDLGYYPILARKLLLWFSIFDKITI